MSNFSPVTDSHNFPDPVFIGDTIEISIKINGAEAMVYSKAVDQAPDAGGQLMAQIIIKE
jgi:acyl dehydratase